MKVVFLQESFSSQERELLGKEFPECLFLTVNDETRKQLSDDHWSQVEILYNTQLTKKELDKAQLLKWIHSPSTNTDDLCIQEIIKNDLTLTYSKKDNKTQVAEFALGTILLLAKNILSITRLQKQTSLWKKETSSKIWTLKNKRLLLVGLEGAGSEIAKQAKQWDMEVWGVGEKQSFHPYCTKTYAMSHLHSLLPAADVVIINLEKENHYFSTKDLKLMQNNTLLLILERSPLIDLPALTTLCKTKPFHGVAIDVAKQRPIPLDSPLWNSPFFLATPSIASLPEKESTRAFSLFRQNLRHYLRKQYDKMEHVYRIAPAPNK